MLGWRKALLVASATVAGVAVLSLLGEALAPRPKWEAQPYERSPLADSDTSVTEAVPDSGVESGYDVRREEVSIPVRGDELAATVFSPDAPGRYPALAFVHGAGSGGRGSHLGLAESFARTGIVAVAYDKRSDYSYFWNRDFGQLAEDAVAVVRMMRQREDVDSERAGLWGLSEGGRVVPLAASRSADVGFIVTVGGAIRGPLRNTAWSVYEGLAAAGAPAGARRLAVHALGGGYLFTLHLDPPPGVWTRVDQPALVIYGNEDFLVPPAESSRTIVDELKQAGNSSYAVRFFAGASHGLRVDEGYAPGYLETMTSWITGLPGGAESVPEVAGELPVQRYESTVVPRTPWYGGSYALAATVVLAFAGAVVIPIVARRRLRASTSTAWNQVDQAARWSTRAAVLAFVTLWAYMGLLIGLGYTRTGSAAVFQVGWGVVRVMAMVAVAFGVILVLRHVGARRSGQHFDRTQRLVLAGRSGVVALMLLNIAYWGVFAATW